MCSCWRCGLARIADAATQATGGFHVALCRIRSDYCDLNKTLHDGVCSSGLVRQVRTFRFAGKLGVHCRVELDELTWSVPRGRSCVETCILTSHHHKSVTVALNTFPTSRAFARRFPSPSLAFSRATIRDSNQPNLSLIGNVPGNRMLHSRLSVVTQGVCTFEQQSSAALCTRSCAFGGRVKCHHCVNRGAT